MQNEIMSRILNEMIVDLNRQHLMKLKEVLEKTLKIEKIYKVENKDSINNSLIDSFISSKKLEECSKKINYYQYTLDIIFNNR